MDVSYKRFLGKYNVDDSPDMSFIRLTQGKGATFLSQADNIDIDKYGRLSRRPGGVKKLSGRFRSVWANSEIVLAVADGNLVRIFPTNGFQKVVLKSNVGDFDMSYVTAGRLVYYTNDVVVGYIDNGVAYDLPTSTFEYKRNMPTGHLLEYYNGRLYVAKGSGSQHLVIYSDPANLNVYDARSDRSFFILNSKATMMKAVSDGLWMSDGNSTFFLQGGSPSEMVKNNMANYGALYGSAYSEEGVHVNGEFYSKAVVFDTVKGLCVGGSGGRFVNLTKGVYLSPSAQAGAGAIVRGNINKYLVIRR